MKIHIFNPETIYQDHVSSFVALDVVIKKNTALKSLSQLRKPKFAGNSVTFVVDNNTMATIETDNSLELDLLLDAVNSGKYKEFDQIIKLIRSGYDLVDAENKVFQEKAYANRG